MTTKRPDKSDPNTPAAESSAAVWFKLYPAKWAGLAMREPDNSKLGERVRRIVLALCEQEPGADAFADEVMQSTAEAMKAAREKAQKAAFARWEKERRERKKKGCPSNAQASDGGSDSCPSNAKRRDLEEERRGDLEEHEREGGALTQSEIEIPSFEVFQRFGQEQGFNPARVEKCFRFYEASGWRDTKGHPVRNWKAKLSSWMNRPELESTKAGKPDWRAERAQKEYPPNAKPTVE